MKTAGWEVGEGQAGVEGAALEESRNGCVVGWIYQPYSFLLGPSAGLLAREEIATSKMPTKIQIAESWGKRSRDAIIPTDAWPEPVVYPTECGELCQRRCGQDLFRQLRALMSKLVFCIITVL